MASRPAAAPQQRRLADGEPMVSEQIALAASGDELLANPEVGRLFLGG
jgi:hypothetical protein